MSWIECYLEEVASISSGFAFKSNEMSVESGTPVIKIKNINDRKVYKKTDTYLPSKFYNVKYDKYILKEGDILVAMTGQGSVGRIGKMSNVDREYLINQRVGIIKAKEKICDNEFLFQLIATPENEKKYFNLAQGAGQPNLSPKDIGALEISIPTSLETQKRIASILSAYDDLIENNLKRIKLLEETAQNIYKEWFVNFHFPNYENTSISQETGLPEGWEMKKVEDCIKVMKGKKPKKEYTSVGENRILYLLVDVLERRELRFTENENVQLTSDGETLMLMDGSRSGMVFKSLEGAIGSTLAVFRIKNNVFGIDYCFNFFKCRETEIISKNTGSAIPHANKNYIYGMEIPIPSEKISNEFESITNKIYKQIESLSIQNQKLKEARDILLPRLMNRTIEV